MAWMNLLGPALLKSLVQSCMHLCLGTESSKGVRIQQPPLPPTPTVPVRLPPPYSASPTTLLQLVVSSGCSGAHDLPTGTPAALTALWQPVLAESIFLCHLCPVELGHHTLLTSIQNDVQHYNILQGHEQKIKCTTTQLQQIQASSFPVHACIMNYTLSPFFSGQLR